MTPTEFPLKQLINGRWCDATNQQTWALVDPANETILQHVPYGDSSDAQQAIDAAAAAFADWSQRTPYERAEVLTKAAEWIHARAAHLATLTTEESGKPYAESLAEWRSATSYLTWFAAEAPRAYGRTIPARIKSRRIQVLQQSLGVVGTITAWNFPVYNIVRTWAAALAAGCTVVGRPSEYTPRSGMLLAQALHEAGAPAGVINLINGDPAAMADAMLTDKRVRKIAFTGSPAVGKKLMDKASKTMTQLALELGGNAPVIVFPDVDVAKIAELSVSWKYRNCGQVCVAPQRFYVHADIYEAFLRHAKAHTQALTLGHGLDKNTSVGPLINEKQRERVAQLVKDSQAQGATVLTGGNKKDGKGYFYEATLLRDVQPGHAVHDEEIFGPVMPVIAFNSTEDVLRLANQTNYGLAAFVMTNDLNTSIRMSEQLEFGMVCVNDWLPATPEAPFGGVKGSGFGRETGLEGLREYMEVKTVFTGGVV